MWKSLSTKSAEQISEDSINPCSLLLESMVYAAKYPASLGDRDINFDGGRRDRPFSPAANSPPISCIALSPSDHVLLPSSYSPPCVETRRINQGDVEQINQILSTAFNIPCSIFLPYAFNMGSKDAAHQRVAHVFACGDWDGDSRCGLEDELLSDAFHRMASIGWLLSVRLELWHLTKYYGAGIEVKQTTIGGAIITVERWQIIWMRPIIEAIWWEGGKKDSNYRSCLLAAVEETSVEDFGLSFRAGQGWERRLLHLSNNNRCCE